MTRDWPKSVRHDLNPDPLRGAEAGCSVRPADLQNAERLLWDVSAIGFKAYPR